MRQKQRDYSKEGEQAYQNWQDTLMADPEIRAAYREDMAQKELWLQLVEAREAAGITQEELANRLGISQAQVARIEKLGFDAYTLGTLRRYVEALGRTIRITVV